MTRNEGQDSDVEVLSEQSEKIESAETEAEKRLRVARSLTVESPDDFEAATAELAAIRDQQDAVDEFFEPMRESTHAAYQAVLNRRREVKSPLETAEEILEEEIKGYHRAQQKKSAQREREAVERAREQARERRQEQIEAAREAGDEERVERLEQAPVEPDPNTLQEMTDEEVAESEDVYLRDNWSVTVESLEALVEAAAEDPSLLRFLQADQSQLRKAAQGMGDALRVPGVSTQNDPVVVRK